MKRIELAIAAILLSSTPLGAALAVEQAGVTAAVRGVVNLDPVTGEAAHAAQSGEDVFLGDGISSGDQSGLQLMLLDETIFTVGANTELTIDEFVYDPATGAGQMSASLTKGVFRFVAGKIAQGDPDDMTINLPTGTIGIRGTTGVVAMLDESLLDSDVLDFLDPGEGILTGSVILAVLLETAKDGDPDSKGMVVSAQGESVELSVPGWGSLISPGLPPTPAFFVPALPILKVLFANLTRAGIGGPQASLSSGEGGTLALAGPLGVPKDPYYTGLPPIIDNSDNTDIPADEEIKDGPIAPAIAAAIEAVSGAGFTTFDQLFALADSAVYSANGIFTQTLKLNDAVNIQGTFSATLDIDFTTRTFCFGSCSIIVNTSSFGGNISDSTGVTAIDYSNDTGLAGGVLDSSDLTNANFAGTSVGLINSDGIIANQGVILILYDDGSGNQGTGGGLSNPRSPI